MKARVNGTELYFDVEGPGLVAEGPAMIERPVVMALHGGPGGDHVSLRDSLSPLSDSAQFIYLDHRGAGRSATADPATCTLDQNIDDVDALREHLGLDRISVLGVSYGGMVAQGYAIRYPERVTNLMLVVTAPSYRFLDDARRIVKERGSPEQQRVCQRLWAGAFTSIEQLHEYYRVMGPLYSTTFDEQKFEINWNRSRRNCEPLNTGFGGFLQTFDFTEDLSAILCPTLVICGAHDWICAPSHSREIAAEIPRAHLKIFRNSAHAVMADEPEAFRQVIRGFLRYSE
ncbi:MAG: alpha/beta fold hydrolase [Planctomycetaceae bacterium]